MVTLYNYLAEEKKNPKWQAKFDYVMKEFGDGKLKDPQGNVIKDQKQAVAIAYAEADKRYNRT